jgi:O-succinylbenzoate synthase
MARAAVEEAVHDLEARRRGIPLHRLYAGERPVRDRVPVGISLGIQDDFEVRAEQIADAVSQGYARIKLKIEPGRDVEVVRRVRERFGDIPLMVDANCAYDRDGAAPLEALDELGLLMIEQPFEHDDVETHAWLQQRIETPVCADELAATVEATRRVLDHDASRIVNIKCSRLGGRTNGIAVHDMCQERGVPVWCGGMLESGVGRLHNIAVASLPNFTMPSDLSASRRYWHEDVIDPPVELGEDGTVRVPAGPGLGHEIREDVIEEHLVCRETLCP